MTIDISPILKEIGEKIDIDGSVKLADTDFLGEYHFKEPLLIKGNISNNGKSFTLKAMAEGSMITNCARCMKEITVPVKFRITEDIAKGNSEDYGDDTVIISDNTFEIDDIVRDNFLVNIEGKYLCKEDCKGLCPTCGKDLNEGDCDCQKESIDPRWSALLDIMNNNE